MVLTLLVICQIDITSPGGCATREISPCTVPQQDKETVFYENVSHESHVLIHTVSYNHSDAGQYCAP